MKSSPGTTPASGTMPPEVPRRNLRITIDAYPQTWAGAGRRRGRKLSKQKRPSHRDERRSYLRFYSRFLLGLSLRPGAVPRGLVHSRRSEFLLDALVMVPPLDDVIEFGAFLFGELRFHLGNRLGELLAVEILQRGSDVGKDGKAALRQFGKAAEHDHLLMGAAGRDGQDTRADRGNDRRMPSEHAEIAFHAGDVNLIDLAGEGELFGRDEIEMKGSHGKPASSEWRMASSEGRNGSELFATPY